MIKDLTEICRYLETKYPEEGCGLVFEETDGTFRVHPMDNVYDKYHSKDPVTYPRDNRTAYLFSPMEFQRLSEKARNPVCGLPCRGSSGRGWSPGIWRRMAGAWSRCSR